MQQMQDVIISQQREIDAIRAREQRQTISAAISAAIDESGVELNPHARQQFIELVRPGIGLISHGGQLVAAGEGLKPVGQVVKEKLGSDEFSHFRRGGGPQAPAPGQAASSGQGQQPNESLGAFIVRQAGETRSARAASSPPPALDMSQSFGLRPRR
jgi:hypothetical protein